MRYFHEFCFLILYSTYRLSYPLYPVCRPAGHVTAAHQPAVLEEAEGTTEEGPVWGSPEEQTDFMRFSVRDIAEELTRLDAVNVHHKPLSYHSGPPEPPRTLITCPLPLPPLRRSL